MLDTHIHTYTHCNGRYSVVHFHNNTIYYNNNHYTYQAFLRNSSPDEKNIIQPHLWLLREYLPVCFSPTLRFINRLGLPKSELVICQPHGCHSDKRNAFVLEYYDMNFGVNHHLN